MGTIESLVILIIVIAGVFAILRLFPLPAPFSNILQIVLGVIAAVIAVRVIFLLLVHSGLHLGL